MLTCEFLAKTVKQDNILTHGLTQTKYSNTEGKGQKRRERIGPKQDPNTSAANTQSCSSVSDV